MKILVVKLTSMGDVLHVLPALSDLAQKIPEVEVDWLVEESFSDIPTWHDRVENVIAVATRRWRRFKWSNLVEIKAFLRQLRQKRYDVIIDAQGLLKSAILARLARINSTGERIGFNRHGLREPAAARFYTRTIHVAKDAHAVDRLRRLFATAFDYPLEAFPKEPEYGIRHNFNLMPSAKTVFFAHGTSWPSKHLPDQLWLQLIDCATSAGYEVFVTWGNDAERARAKQMAGHSSSVTVLEKTSLTKLTERLVNCDCVIAVDTGIAHIAAALGIPTLSIYGASNAMLTGAKGQNQTLLQTDIECSPCLQQQCFRLSQSVSSEPCYQLLSATELWQQMSDLKANKFS